MKLLCSRSVSRAACLLLASVLILGSTGCASGKARTKWWQFWRPKAQVAMNVPNTTDTIILPDSTGLDGAPDIVLSEPGYDEYAVEDGFPAETVSDDQYAEPEVIREPATTVGGDLITVQFAFDSSQLSQTAQSQLDQNLQWIKDHPGIDILIEGHCDERGTLEYNMHLGAQRAASVKAYLVSQGVAPDKLHTISYGEERPLDMGTGDSAWSQNRRADFLVY